MIVGLEVSDDPQLPLSAEDVVEAQRATQLTHAQVPLEGFGVLWKHRAAPLLRLSAERHHFPQPTDELKTNRKHAKKQHLRAGLQLCVYCVNAEKSSLTMRLCARERETHKVIKSLTDGGGQRRVEESNDRP